MKRLSLGVVAILFALASTSASMAQSQGGGVAVVFSDKPDATPRRDNSWEVHQLTFYLGGPGGSVPCKPIEGRKPPLVTKFNIRAWREGGGVRVVIYAVIPDERLPYLASETPMATRLMSAGGSTVPPTWKTNAEFDEGDEWNCGPVFVSIVPTWTLPPR
jgi:hypothetical protein